MSFNISYNFIAKDRFTSVQRKVNNSVKKSKRNFKDLGNEYQRTGRKFQRTTNQIKRNSASIASGLKGLFIGGAIVLGFRKLITVGAEFQDSMLDLSAITGATGKDLDTLKQKTFDLAKATFSSQSQILNAFKLVASAKPELLENVIALGDMTEQVLLLKNASGIDLAQAADVAASTLNIYGKSAQFAARFVDILAAGSKFGGSMIGQTGEAIALAGNNAKDVGISFLDLNVAIQAVALGSIKGARAGTALNAIFGRLQRIRGLDFAEGLPETFEKIKIAIDKITDTTDRAIFVQQIFGEEHGKVGLAMIDRIKIMKDLQIKLKTEGIAQEQATLRLSSFNSKMRRLSAIIGEKLIKAFLKLEPALLQVTNEFGRFVQAITPEQIDLFVAAVGGAMKSAVAIVRAAVENIALMFKDFDIVAFTGKVDSAFASIEKLAGAAGAIANLPGRLAGAAAATPGFIANLPTLPVRAGVSLFQQARGMFNSAPSAPVTNTNNARADVNVNLNAPPGVIQSTSTSTSGNRQAMNLGLNVGTN